MADNAGKPGEAPTSTSGRTSDRGPVSARRDPRADPDDHELPVSERVDVVSMDRGNGERPSSIDSLTNAALTLRRELAKLHQQAAAVERTIEDQRRERTDALERAEAVHVRATELEQRAEAAEAEVANLKKLHDQVRSERDELARSLEQSKTAAEDLERAREELATVRREKEEAARASTTFENELAEIRKREQAGAQKASDTEGELQAVRERFERTSAELLSAREEVTAAKAETVKFRQEASVAAETAAQKLSESEHERLAAKEQVGRLEASLAEMRTAQEKVTRLDADLTRARMELVDARAKIGRLERDVEDIRAARDVANERATMAEKERDDARKEIERLQQSLEAANTTATNANARAAAAERSRATSEDSVRTLRDEITTAFARWRSASPSVPPPPGSVAPPTRAVPLAEMAQHVTPAPFPRHSNTTPEPAKVNRSNAQTSPPSAITTSAATVVAIPPQEAETRPVLIDDDWISPSNVPPPKPSSAPPSQTKLPSIKPPPVPPPLPARAKSIPPAVYPSVPPPVPIAPLPPQAPTTPPPRAEESSVVHYVSQERANYIELLGSPNTSRQAALALREHPDWLRGRPPIELLLALTLLDYDIDDPVFELARMWDRDPLCRALVAALRDEPEPKMREHAAWLLKHLGAAASWPAIAELVSTEEESPSVRRWLLEAIERLVATRVLGWAEVGDLCHRLIKHPSPALRDGVIGVISSLERSDEKRRLLLDVLRTDSDEVVLASAVHALTTALPIELDPSVAERLLGHPSARVQQSVVEFVGRSKRAAKNA